jgi:histidyl-tRNA synthetase
MSEKLQLVRGMKDIFAEEMEQYLYIVDKARKIAKLHSLSEIATPILEFSEVFKRTLGDTSDVVTKETYSFQDRGGDNITLRPEFTAAICRSMISNSWFHDLPKKLFSVGPLFRYERPQKGRLRQFHQLNFEYIGSASSLADVEMIAMGNRLIEELGVKDKVEIEINSLGCKESRASYRKHLIEYLQDFKNQLSEDSKVRLEKNPLRILDSKDDGDKKIIANAPMIQEHFTNEARDFFATVCEGLIALNIKFIINPKIVRGLDYYCHTAFEFTTKDLGAQGTVLAGGRYDNLIEMLGGPSTPAVGFASGIERLMLLLNVETKTLRPIAIIAISESVKLQAICLLEQLHEIGICAEFDYDANSVAKQMKKANKRNAKLAIFIGEDELQRGVYKIKNLDSGEETEIQKEKLAIFIEPYKI